MSKSDASLADLIDRCRKARAAIEHAESARDQAAGRMREIGVEIAQLEAERDTADAETAALSAAGIGSKSASSTERRLLSLETELESVRRAQTGGAAAVKNLRTMTAKCRDDLNSALDAAAMGVLAEATRKYAEAIQVLRDALYAIEEIEDRPTLLRKTVIPDLEPGTYAFRSTTPSPEIELALEEFRPALDERRFITLTLEPMIGGR